MAMFDSATLTVSGNVVADPKVTGSADTPDRVVFRVVSNRRRRDIETGEWKQVGEVGINVVCWRRLARGVAQSLRKGDPVLVQGRLTERRYVGEDQQTRWMTELVADFVGHDLSQGHAGRFSRFTQIDSALTRVNDTVEGSATPDNDADFGAGAASDEDSSDLDGLPTAADFEAITPDAFTSSEPAAAVFG